MSNLKGRLEKMESIAHGSKRPVYVWLNPGESREQALERRRAQYPTIPLDPTAEVIFITWGAPDSDNAYGRGTV
jgi:hypothetical protein